MIVHSRNIILFWYEWLFFEKHFITYILFPDLLRSALIFWDVRNYLKIVPQFLNFFKTIALVIKLMAIMQLIRKEAESL